MRSILCAAALAVAAGCSNDAGAILVLANPAGMPVDHVEVVLASASGDNGEDTIITVKQREAVMHLNEEDVRYYKQESTSKLVSLDDKDADGFTVIVTPDTAGGGKKKFIPFVFAYDAAGALVGVGRITMGDADDTPAAIAIPTGQLEQYPVELEAMSAPDLVETGIQANTGAVVACATDGVVRGAAWRFAKGIQLRIVFARPGETDGVANPYDLDCDDHTVDAAADASAFDCNDLRDVTYRGAPEVCGDDDRNCDMAPPAGQSACGPLVIPDHGLGQHFGTCPGLTGCGTGTDVECEPDPSQAASDACFCYADPSRCVMGMGCELEERAYDASGGVTYQQCTPEFTAMPLPNPCMDGANQGTSTPCLVTVAAVPQTGMQVQIGVVNLATQPPTIAFGNQVTLNGIAGDHGNEYVMKVTPEATFVPMPPDQLGDVVLAVTPPAPAPSFRYYIALTTKSVTGTGDESGGCTTRLVTGAGTKNVDTMSCSRGTN